MSRNQREGKFVPGWCYNPGYKRVNGVIVEKTRAGAHFRLVKVRNYNDHGYVIPGVTYIRYFREGAFE